MSVHLFPPRDETLKHFAESFLRDAGLSRAERLLMRYLSIFLGSVLLLILVNLSQAIFLLNRTL